MLDSNEFRSQHHLLSMALGKDISGKPVVVDLQNASTCLWRVRLAQVSLLEVNTMIFKVCFRVTPDQVEFIMIDPESG